MKQNDVLTTKTEVYHRAKKVINLCSARMETKDIVWGLANALRDVAGIDDDDIIFYINQLRNKPDTPASQNRGEKI